VLLQGKISKKCGKRNICKVITKPYKSFYYAFKEKLKKEGISVQGNMRLRRVPSNAKLLLTHYSNTLEKIVSKTAKKSNNLYARHLLLILGAKTYGAPATLTKGRRAVESILRANRALGFGSLDIDNGSGLSRTAEITAKLLSDMYEHAYINYANRWIQTLSIAGVDGTIKKRFRGTVVKNRAWMKTGTLKRVKNIGGYVKSKSGKLYTAVILVQSNRGNWRASKLQNDIIKWLVNYTEPVEETLMVENAEVTELMNLETKVPEQVSVEVSAKTLPKTLNEKEGTLY
jgi:D-alanyl-D-alanine carboxypeptidase/D-alanyl-D-alanine-endopeptidase (penicillin-binding protein 4)